MSTVPVTDRFPLPPGFEGVQTPLDDIFRTIGVSDVVFNVVSADSTFDITENVEYTEAELDGMETDQPPEVLPPAGVPEDPPVEPTNIRDADGGYTSSIYEYTISFEVFSEVAVALPGLIGVEIFLNPGTFTADLRLSETDATLESTLSLAVRVNEQYLVPVRRVVGSDPVAFESDPNRAYVQFDLASATLSVGSNGVDIQTDAGVSLSEPAMIGDTGIVVESADLEFNFTGESQRPTDTPSNWKGIFCDSATIRLPDLFDGTIVAADLGIGSGGVTGTISATDVVDGKFMGLTGSVEDVSITLKQNVPVAGSVVGEVVLPYFEERVELTVAICADGFRARVTDAPDGERDDSTGLITLTRPNAFELVVESLDIIVAKTTTVSLGGTITPDVPGLDLPGVRIETLSIDAEGNVDIEGGWMNLRDAYSVDFYGFTFEVTKLGLGTNEDETRWIGLNGSLKFTDELAAGGSVEGMRVTWGDGSPSVSFDGLGVEFEVPEVVRFDGAVAFEDTSEGQRFVGDIQLELITLDLTIDAKLVVGQTSDPTGEYTYFGIYVGTELPRGIPLFSTGLALYGMAGLYAQNYEPNKGESEKWYAVDESVSYYHRGEDGVTDIVNKWRSQRGSLALGAGVTIGTAPDNGFAFSGRLLLAIVFPGPVIMLQGRANLLKPRAELASGEPTFGALAVLDNREESIQLGLDARYMTGSGGELIDIGARAEAYYDFNDPTAWHINLGKREPRDQRLRASYLSLFEANAYFMLNPDRIALGAWYGYDAHFGFGPLGVDIEAWIEGNALVNFNPTHFYADLWLHGKVALRAFGFKLGITVDALLAADVFDPFHVLGDFRVALELPWPLPDPSAEVTVEWGPTLDPPAIPNPLKEIALEHERSTAAWRLPREPAADPDGGDDYAPLLVSTDEANRLPPAKLPVVPPDIRPQLSFTRPVHDGTTDSLTMERTGWNAQPVEPEYERLGDPSTGEGPVEVKYVLNNVKLSEWDEEDDQWRDAGEVFGAWTPWPALSQVGSESLGRSEPAVGNTKLTLYTRNPFEAFRNGGGSLIEDLPLSEYPCPRGKLCFAYKDMPREELLVRTEPKDDILAEIGGQQVRIEQDEVVASNWRRAWPSVRHRYDQERGVEPDLVKAGGEGYLRCRTKRRSFTVRIDLPQPFQSVQVAYSPDKYATNLAITVIDTDGGRTQEELTTIDVESYIHTSDEAKLIAVEIATWGWDSQRHEESNPYHTTTIHEVCAADYPLDGADPRVEAMQGAIDRFGEQGAVLKPNTTYRLEVDTTADAIGIDGFDWSEKYQRVEYAYFQTGSAPGIDTYATPIGISKPEEFESGLEDLSRYVAETVPRSPAGRNPDLPRPIYRGYDITVAFAADYVHQLYRMGKRDLTTLLFDANGNPIRATDGRLFIAEGEWETAEHTPTEADRQLRETIENSSCLTLDSRPKRDDAIRAGGYLLAPDTRHDILLRPVLLHDRFADDVGWSTFAGTWLVIAHNAFRGKGATIASAPNEVTLDMAPSGLLPGRDSIYLADDEARRTKRYRIDAVDNRTLTLDGEPLLTGTSDWAIPAAGVASVDNVTGDGPAVFAYNGVADSPDAQQPENWTDYRAEVVISAPSANAILGVDVRRSAAGAYRYLVKPDGTRKLLFVSADGETELASADGDRPPDESYRIVVEAIGKHLRVYEPKGHILSATDDRHASGTVAVVADMPDVAVASFRVDDFRAGSPAVYRFPFVTSQYTTFRHQLHSFEDETWSAMLPASTDLTNFASPNGLGSDSARPPEPPTAAEQARYKAVVSGLQVLPLDKVEMVRLEEIQSSGGPVPCAFWLRSPEPIDWERTHIDLYRAAPGTELGLPGRVKLIDATLSTAQSVNLLAREEADPSGWRLEHEVPDPSAVGEPLFTEEFGDGLDSWTFVDEPPYTIRESDWRIENGRLVQRSNIYGFVGGPYNEPGTFGVIGDTDWTDYELTVDLQSRDNDAIGVIFRYRDPENFYRFSMDAERGYRRLVKRVDGRTHLLWADDDPFTPGELNTFSVRCVGGALVGQLDGTDLFDVYDEDHLAGSVGVYCRANVGAEFHSLTVQRVATRWSTYHEFGEENVLHDGDEVVVHEGIREDAPFGVYYRRRNGSARLNNNRAAVRIVTANGQVVHQREFRRRNEYRKIMPQVLRNTDGTGMLITTPSGLPGGQYRLVLTYRRKGEPDRPRDGDLTVESAVLDIPYEPLPND